MVEYLLGEHWVFAGDFMFEREAVEKSRVLWRGGAQGIRVLRVATTVHKEAKR